MKAAVVVLLAALATSASAAAASPPVQARSVLSPQVVLFGDTVRARIELTVDRTRVDPDSLRARADFSPWELVAPPERARRDANDTSSVRFTFVLRCLTSSCVPASGSSQFDFPAAVVTDSAGGRLRVAWPRLVVNSRKVSSAQIRAARTPWQADLLSMPQVSYRIPPGLLFALLLAAGSVAALAGAGLALRALPRRRPEPEPLPVPVAPPLPPLERALTLLEAPAVENGNADRRRALELVADALADRDARLAAVARGMAWSADKPSDAETSGLASQARAVLPLEKDGDA
jgi:hypothetical protein